MWCLFHHLISTCTVNVKFRAEIVDLHSVYCSELQTVKEVPQNYKNGRRTDYAS